MPYCYDIFSLVGNNINDFSKYFPKSPEINLKGPLNNICMTFNLLYTDTCMWCMVYLQKGFSICTGSLSSDRSFSLARQVMILLYELFSTFSLKTFPKLIEVPFSNHSYVILGKPLNAAGWEVDVLEQLNVTWSPTPTLFCPIIVGFFGCPKI